MKVTPAERAALEAYAKHGGVKQAAHALHKSPRTVGKQIASAQQRVGAVSPVQTVARVLIPDMGEPSP
jgi:DNA-binding transcriptional LysR family regulator